MLVLSQFFMPPLLHQGQLCLQLLHAIGSLQQLLPMWEKCHIFRDSQNHLRGGVFSLQDLLLA
jgi:hypothetical protein